MPLAASQENLSHWEKIVSIPFLSINMKLGQILFNWDIKIIHFFFSFFLIVSLIAKDSFPLLASHECFKKEKNPLEFFFSRTLSSFLKDHRVLDNLHVEDPLDLELKIKSTYNAIF